MEEEERKRLVSEIHSRLQSDLLASDALLSLLVAAATSIRHDSLLKPFPPSIPSSADGHKDISQLVPHYLFSFCLPPSLFLLSLLPHCFPLQRSLLKSLQSLDQLLHSMDNVSSSSSSLPISLPCLQLLHWAIFPRHFSLHYMTVTEVIHTRL